MKMLGAQRMTRKVFAFGQRIRGLRCRQEQRDLERKYEELIAARGQLKGLCNKAGVLVNSMHAISHHMTFW